MLRHRTTGSQAMKALLFVCMLVAAAFTWAAGAVTGEVLEVKDVESYTYLRLRTANGETWAAVATAPVKKGALVTIENITVMNNFESKSLKRTFQTVVFGNLAGKP